MRRSGGRRDRSVLLMSLSGETRRCYGKCEIRSRPRGKKKHTAEQRGIQINEVTYAARQFLFFRTDTRAPVTRFNTLNPTRARATRGHRFDSRPLPTDRLLLHNRVIRLTPFSERVNQYMNAVSFRRAILDQSRK